MKPIFALVLLLLLSAPAWGQIDTSRVLEENWLKKYPPGRLDDRRLVQPVIRPDDFYRIMDDAESGQKACLTLRQLIAEWDAYAAECHADSTRHDRLKDSPYQYEAFGCDSVWDGTIWSTIKNGKMISGRDAHPRFYWTHRDPTFPGFIEWLRGKRGI